MNYPYKCGKYVHILFLVERVSGVPRPTSEASEIGYFAEHEIPPLSDGHDVRIALGFRALRDPAAPTYFE